MFSMISGVFAEKIIVVNKKHCCDMMDYSVNYICPNHEDPFDCHYHIIYYDSVFDEYGIIRHDTIFDEDGNIIHEASRTVTVIYYCPWCGSKLPMSKRKRWFETIWKLGFEPDDEEIPEKFKTDEWYRTKS